MSGIGCHADGVPVARLLPLAFSFVLRYSPILFLCPCDEASLSDSAELPELIRADLFKVHITYVAHFCSIRSTFTSVHMHVKIEADTVP